MLCYKANFAIKLNFCKNEQWFFFYKKKRRDLMREGEEFQLNV